MKKFFLLCTLAISSNLLFAQSQNPQLSLTGGSVNFNKGTINTEVLTQIIQEKQDEVKKQVFRNIIVKDFNKFDYTKELKNFTTYHYIYNIMNTLVEGKDKTAMTK